MTTERQHRDQIVRFGRMIHERGYVAATDGNLSVRLDKKRILVTPTSMCKGMMSPSDLVIVDTSGKKLSGRRDVSSEIAMHLLIYKLRPDIRAIVHAHPPTATGYAAAGVPLNEALISEVVICLGAVPLAKYGTPGTPELTDALQPMIPEYDAILMSNHGVVAYGEDLLHAYMKMETVEHFAKVALVAHQLGRQQLLSPEEIEKLLVIRRKYAAVSSVAPMPPAANHNGSRPANGDGAPPIVSNQETTEDPAGGRSRRRTGR